MLRLHSVLGERSDEISASYTAWLQINRICDAAVFVPEIDDNGNGGVKEMFKFEKEQSVWTSTALNLVDSP